MTARPWLFVLAITACTPPDPSPPDTLPPVERRHVLTITPNLDLLFVIDDSPSMLDKQNAFNRAFPALLDQLSAAPGGLPNLHLGVASSDLGTSASGSGTPAAAIGTVGQGGCALRGKGGDLLVGTAPVDGTYLRADRDGTDNFAGTLADAFDAMARLGASGCGFEQPLGAMRAALDDNPHNAGFLRANANLGVIVLSDEDDCSVSNPAFFGPPGGDLGNLDSFRCFRHGVECVEDTATLGVKTQCRPRAASSYVADTTPFRDFLLGLKPGEPRRVMFGAVVAAPARIEVETRQVAGQDQIALAHACGFETPSGPAVADPGVRFAALASGLPRAKLASICNDDLTAQAAQLGQALRGLVEDTCLAEALPPAADCAVTDHAADGSTADVPFQIVDDASCAGSNQRVQLERASAPAFDTYATLACAPPSL